MEKMTKAVLAMFLVLILIFGSILLVYYFQEPTESEEKQESMKGSFKLLISDAPADIADFDSLVVIFSHARIFPTGDNESGKEHFELALNGSQADLTQLVGETALPILNTTLEVGNYSKIELHAEDVEGVLVSGDIANVKIPSEKLQITKSFEVKANETTRFVFDINVVKKGHGNEYNLQPVISESGVIGKHLKENEVKEVSKEEMEKKKEKEKEKDEGTRGNFELLISDAPANISDFDSLTVTFSQARIFTQDDNGSESNFTMFPLNGTEVDLTLLIGPNATSILNTSLEVGNYSKIELYVANVTGTVDGERVNVTVPSDKLQITIPFQVKANENTKFVFDINVVKKGHKDDYNLLPVISESGVVGEDLSEEEVEEV